MDVNLHDIVTIENIHDKDFTFEYDRASGNYPYTILAGEIKRFPRYLAKHCVDKLITEILNDRGQKTNNMMLRDQLAEKIVIEEEVFQQKPKMTEADVLQKRMDQLNKPSDLEAILKKRRDKFKTQKKVEERKEPDVDKTPPKKEEFAGLKKAPPVPAPAKPLKKATTPPQKPQPKPEPEPEPVKDEVGKAISLPTRKELYAHAENTLKIPLTDEVKKKFGKLKVNELIKELDYPLTDLLK